MSCAKYYIFILYNIPYILVTIIIHRYIYSKVQSMDDNCGEWVECMGVVSRRWVWLVGVGGIYGCD